MTEQIDALVVDTLNNVWIGIGGNYYSKIGILKDSVYTKITQGNQTYSGLIQNMQVDERNRVFVIRDESVNVFDNNKEQFITAGNKIDDSYYNLFFRNGKMWGNGPNAVYKVNPNTFNTFRYDTSNSPLENRWFQMAELDNNNNFIVIDSNAIVKFTTDSVQRIPFNNIQDVIYFNKTIFSFGGDMVFDADNNMWFGTSVGVLKYDGTNWTKFNDTTSVFTSTEMIHTMFRDSNNGLWALGYYVYRFNGTNWYKFTDFDGNQISHPRVIKLDKNNTIWISNWTNDIYAYNPNGIPFTSVKEDTKNSEITFTNPVNKELDLAVTLKSSAMTRIEIYDLLGSKISTTFNEFREIGMNEFKIDCTSLTSGTYIVKIQNGNNSESFKFIKN
jgi:streptogramin lyase